MGLKDIKVLKRTLDSSTNSLVEEFFIPVLSESIQYDRGVGYFTSGWLTSVAEGIIPLVEKKGRIRLVTSPNLQPKDYEAMLLGDKARQDKTIFNALVRDVTKLSKDLKDNVRIVLSWLIADGIMDIKIAIPRNKLSGGDFHVKFGVLTDENKDQVLFMGSYNDTEHANLNYEEIAIFRSWEQSEIELVNQKQVLFERIWKDKDPNIKIFEIPNLLMNSLIGMKEDSPRPYRLNLNNEIKGMAATFVPRDYQEIAIKNWFDAKNHGILEMATGTGKTKTALCAASYLRDDQNQILLVVAVPTITLSEQWTKEVRGFGFNPIVCSSEKPKWKSLLNDELIKLNFDPKKSLALICTHETLKSISFNETLNRLNNKKIKVLLLADECHHLGSRRTQEAKIFNYDFTLGLSATPERFFDEDGSKFVKELLGKVVFKFSLRDAIKGGFLCPYDYYVHEVYLTASEMDLYIEVSKKIARCIASSGAGNNTESRLDNPRIMSLFNERAKILKKAEGKLVSLRNELLKNKRKIDHAVIFCAPDTNELDQVSILLSEINIISHRFTGEEKDQKILIDFDRGMYQVLTAMNIFNEGVDIPSTKEAFIMSSSTNPTEFVQRRGRVLRKDLKSLKEKAVIHDFIVLPISSERLSDNVYEKKIVQKEIDRCYLFAEDALNSLSVMEKLNELMSKYISLPISRRTK